MGLEASVGADWEGASSLGSPLVGTAVMLPLTFPLLVWCGGDSGECEDEVMAMVRLTRGDNSASTDRTRWAILARRGVGSGMVIVLVIR